MLRILPMLSILISVIAGLYGLYLLYLGLPQLMKAPRDKAVAYTIVVVIASIVVMWVVTLIVGLFAGVGMMGAAAL